MRHQHDASEERQLRELLDRAAAELEPLPEAELAGAARAASAVERPHVRRPRGRRRGPARWALVLAAALALGLAGGIGIGRSLTSAAESAEAPVLPSAAPAFAAAEGWTVVSGGIDLPPGTHAVLAANVPLHARGEPLDLAPGSVLAGLPPDGIVVAVSGRAAQRPARAQSAQVQLRLEDAEPATRWQGPQGAERALAEYALRGERGGLDLDVRVYFGTAEPTAPQLAAAQAQLDRLAVRSAANQVTISARPTLVRWAEQIAVSGAIAGGRAGEQVMVEVRECGTSYWRVVGIATTTSGGQWHTETGIAINGALRARRGNAVSTPVPIRARPGVVLQSFRHARTRVGVVGIRSFYGRQVVLQRFDRARQRWVDMSRARITDSSSAGNFVWSSAHFRTGLTVRGNLYRAVITNQQSGPCYLAGFSNMVRR